MNFTQTILDNISDAVFSVDKNFKITSFNKAAEKMTGATAEKAMGLFCSDVLRANVCETRCPIRTMFEKGTPVLRQTIYIVNHQGEEIPLSVSTSEMRDDENNITGGIVIMRDLRAITALRKELEKSHSFHDIISKNAQMLKLFNIIPQIAQSDSTVLIHGESGTGKELFARVLHNLSQREKHSMVSVNCGALPDTLLEAELFGYKKGAFTDAKQDKIGRFAQAESGTIFLDEIGDVSPAFQVRLLRVLQEKTYEPLGSTQPVKANVRVITATNKDLKEMVGEGTFRQDLYFRLNVIKLTIPPLRERKEDIPILVKHFISKYNQLYDRNIVDVVPEVMSLLMIYDYPGNVRELENILEHAFVLSPKDIIEPEHLPAEFITSAHDTRMVLRDKATLKEIEKEAIIQALERNDFNRLAAATELGINKTTLFRKIKEYELSLPDIDGRTSKK